MAKYSVLATISLMFNVIAFTLMTPNNWLDERRNGKR